MERETSKGITGTIGPQCCAGAQRVPGCAGGFDGDPGLPETKGPQGIQLPTIGQRMAAQMFRSVGPNSVYLEHPEGGKCAHLNRCYRLHAEEDADSHALFMRTAIAEAIDCALVEAEAIALKKFTDLMNGAQYTYASDLPIRLAEQAIRSINPK